ncbi:MAG: hypothetical protein V5A42_02760 [Halofilum sp. (in: g-proteobacteria)]
MSRFQPLAAAAVLILGAALAVPAQAASLSVTTGWADSSESGYDPATIASLRLGTEILDIGIVEFDLGIEAATDIDNGTTASGEDWGSSRSAPTSPAARSVRAT